MALVKLLLVTFAVAVLLQEISGHGMMMDPVSRSSAWRKGFKTPANYNDNELFCGGIGIHHGQNKGKCGLCGDNYANPTPRANENGGVYGTGVIVQKYKTGQQITVSVKLTANHFGTFKFSVCPLKSRNDRETEECFDKHPVRLPDGSDVYTLRTNSGRDFNIPVVLPKGVSCEHCVFRWHYRAANNWGTCPDGSSKNGCGPQETFRNCADISILP